MGNAKKISHALENLGACYKVSHETICDTLKQQAPDLLTFYGEESPLGYFMIVMDHGIEFFPYRDHPGYEAVQQSKEMRAKLDEIASIILENVPDYLMNESIERRSFYQNMTEVKHLLFLLLADIESLKSEDNKGIVSSNIYADETIQELLTYVGLLSEEYSLNEQLIMFSDDSALRCTLLSREEAEHNWFHREFKGVSKDIIH